MEDLCNRVAEAAAEPRRRVRAGPRRPWVQPPAGPAAQAGPRADSAAGCTRVAAGSRSPPRARRRLPSPLAHPHAQAAQPAECLPAAAHAARGSSAAGPQPRRPAAPGLPKFLRHVHAPAAGRSGPRDKVQGGEGAEEAAGRAAPSWERSAPAAPSEASVRDQSQKRGCGLEEGVWVRTWPGPF